MKSTLRKTSEIIKKYNIKANKRYGQNFLIDDNILEKIVQVSNISQNDLVIEIGPGLGNLTEYILEDAKYALLIEIDNNMIDILNERFCHNNNYKLINNDILKININDFISKIEEKENLEFDNIRVVANLPYYITTPILFKLLQDEDRITSVTVMVQKEVADRMVSEPHSKNYGILSIMTQYLSIPKIEISVPNSSFIPAPNVESAVIRLEKVKRYEVKNEKIFFELVHKAFATRRKKMLNSLLNSNFMNIKKDQLENIMVDLGIDLNVRAEELKIDQFIKIADKVYEISSDNV